MLEAGGIGSLHGGIETALSQSIEIRIPYSIRFCSSPFVSASRKRRSKNVKVDKAQRLLTTNDVDALLEKVGSLTELDACERETLDDIVRTWAHVIELSSDRGMSIGKLRQFLGITLGKKTTDDKARSPGSSAPNSQEAKGNTVEQTGAQSDGTGKNQVNRDNHGRRSAEMIGNLAENHHLHSQLAIGCQCPTCEKGKLYEYRPKRFTTIMGQASVSGAVQIIERLQCGFCKEIFTAPISPELEMDGLGNGRNLYGYSAVAVVSIEKFFGGMPWFRQETLQMIMGAPSIPDSTMQDLCERMADAAAPIVELIKRLAKDAPIFYGDDTGATILDMPVVSKPERHSGKLVERTGCHTTVAIAVMEAGHQLAIFKTGIQHTGELIDRLLVERDTELPPPYVMSDCASCNTITVCAVVYGGCNAHGIRRFKALKDDYPEHAGLAYPLYQEIFDAEAYCRREHLDPDTRLEYHREHSQPCFDMILHLRDEAFASKAVEPNSDMGKAFNFMVNNQDRLAAFLQFPGMPIENNKPERILRVPIRVRDSARFFRSSFGAAIADHIWTAGTTAILAGVNVMDYFMDLQRNQEEVRRSPEDWLPWIYRQRAKHARLSGPFNRHPQPVYPSPPF